MDPTRQIRLIIAPIFFYGSLLSALVFSHSPLLILGKNELMSLTTLVAILALASLPLGFLFSTISVILLKVIYSVCGSIYQSALTNNEVRAIWSFLRIDRPFPESNLDSMTRLNVAVTIDHSLIHNCDKGIFEWITRVFSAFLISVHSAIAITAALIIALFLCPTPPILWWGINGLALCCMVVGAWFAKCDYMSMVRFQIDRLRARSSKRSIGSHFE